MIEKKIIKIYKNKILKNTEDIINSMDQYLGYKKIMDILSMIVLCIYASTINPIFILNENQILYLYSTTAQVIAGLYGLTIAGYIYFESRLNDMVNIDETYIDHITILKKGYFLDIFYSGVMSGTAIILSLICIASYREINVEDLNIELIFNLSIIFTIYSMFTIISFSWKVLNPNKINTISIKMKKKIEKEKMKIEYSNEFHKVCYKENLDENKNLYSDFMIIYNNLEKTVHEFADKLTNVYSDYVRINNTTIKDRRPRIATSIKVLEKNSIIGSDDTERLNNLRRYRNALIHGDDFKVDEELFKTLSDVYSHIEAKYKNWQVNNE